MPVAIVAAPFVLAGLGYFIDKSGEAINDTANATIKIAGAAAVGYIVLKKTKVL